MAKFLAKQRSKEAHKNVLGWKKFASFKNAEYAKMWEIRG
jgi:hypothetical protein